MPSSGLMVNIHVTVTVIGILLTTLQVWAFP
jgi:hypothetical protein